MKQVVESLNATFIIPHDDFFTDRRPENKRSGQILFASMQSRMSCMLGSLISDHVRPGGALRYEATEI